MLPWLISGGIVGLALLVLYGYPLYALLERFLGSPWRRRGRS
jgi:hypothetical protein